ncbi:MAG: aminotransferase class IV [Flavobacteriaceae bacterium]
MFPLFESIRIENGKIFLTEFHQKRINKTFDKLYKKENPWELKQIFSKINVPQNGLYKMKFNYSEKKYKIEFKKYLLKKIAKIKCYEINDFTYSFKFSDRRKIEYFYTKKLDCQDILMIKNGYLTDTSYCNIILFDGFSWFTPEKPLLEGVQREKLLESKMISKTKIKLNEINDFKQFRLINAMIKFEDYLPRNISNIIF